MVSLLTVVRSIAATGVLAWLAACAPMETPETDILGAGFDPYDDPSYPPVMGTLTASFDGATTEWTTYDFSVGAFDASAWFSRSYADDAAPGETTFTVIGYPDTDPRARDGLFRLALRLDGPPAAGVAVRSTTIEIIDGRDFAAPRLSGTGTATLTRVDLEPGRSGYGDAAGTFSGRLCEPAGPAESCRTVTGNFATRVQFDGL